MSTPLIERPEDSEYAPYYGNYVSLVPPGDVLRILEDQVRDTGALLRAITGDRAGYRYAPGKWSTKDVVGHVIDTERIFAYRALRFARADITPLPGYEQDDYVANGGFDQRGLADLAAELEHLRRANLLMFGGLDSSALLRRGLANGVEFTVRSLIYIIAGHERHHVRVLRERYL